MDHHRAQGHLLGVVRCVPRRLVHAQKLVGRRVAVAVAQKLVVGVDGHLREGDGVLVGHGAVGHPVLFSVGAFHVGLGHPGGQPLGRAVEEHLQAAEAEVPGVALAVELGVVRERGHHVAAPHGIAHDVHLQQAGAGEAHQHLGHVGRGGAVLAGGHAVLQVDALHVGNHGREVQAQAGSGHGVEGVHGRRLLGVAVQVAGAVHTSVAAALGVGGGGRDAGQLQQAVVGHAHVVGHVRDEHGDVLGHGVQDGLVGVALLDEVVLVVAVAHDDAVRADVALGGELLQRLGDLGEGGALGQVGVQEVLQRAGEVAVRVDEPGQHGRASQVDLLGALGEAARLFQGADVGDAAVVIDEERVGGVDVVDHGDEGGIGEKSFHEFPFKHARVTSRGRRPARRASRRPSRPRWSPPCRPLPS